MRTPDILWFWQARGWKLGPSEGFRLGTRDGEVTGVMVTWLATREAIEQARHLGCSLLIARDGFVFPPDYSGALVDHQLSDRSTLPRLQEVLAGGMTLFGASASLDPLMLAELALALGLPEPQILPAPGPMRPLFHVAPQPASALAQSAWERLGHPQVRVSGDLGRRVARVGVLWGNVACAHNPEGLLPLLEAGVEAVIAGELDEYSMRAAIDLGIPVIEVGHAASLAPGLRRFAALLRGQFPGLCVEYYEQARPWQAM